VKGEGMKKIVYPTDGSKTAKKAIKTVVEIAKATDAKCLVLSVADLGSRWVPSGMESKMDRELRKQAKKLAIEAARKLEREGVATKVETAAGNPSEEIVKLVEREKADLIIMGTHGLTGLARVVIGSVADHVIREANCPVMLVPLR